MPAQTNKPWISENTRLALQVPTIVTISVATIGGGIWFGKMWGSIEEQRRDLDDLQRRVMVIDSLAIRQREMCQATQVLLRYQVPAEARPDLACDRITSVARTEG